MNAREDTQFRRADLFWLCGCSAGLRQLWWRAAWLAAHLQEPKSLTGLEPEILEVEVDPRDPRAADREPAG